MIAPLAIAVLLPHLGCADTVLLLGVSAGGSIAGGHGRAYAPYFEVGTGLDLLDDSGFVATSRAEMTHERDLRFALGAGFFTEGLRGGTGLPLGFTLGGAYQIDRDGTSLAGGRASIALGLWYARAALELEATALDAISRTFTDEPHGIRVAIGLTLRIVPWSPFHL